VRRATHFTRILRFSAEEERKSKKPGSGDQAPEAKPGFTQGMAAMLAAQGATMRDADHPDRANHTVARDNHRVGAMLQQSQRGYEATPQMFVRLTGSRLSRPRVETSPQCACAATELLTG
jgi:hypothetical protein